MMMMREERGRRGGFFWLGGGRQYWDGVEKNAKCCISCLCYNFMVGVLHYACLVSSMHPLLWILVFSGASIFVSLEVLTYIHQVIAMVRDAVVVNSINSESFGTAISFQQLLSVQGNRDLTGHARNQLTTRAYSLPEAALAVTQWIVDAVVWWLNIKAKSEV